SATRRRNSKKGVTRAVLQSGVEKNTHDVQPIIPLSDDDISVVPDSTEGLQPEVAATGGGSFPRSGIDFLVTDEDDDQILLR
ncbi:hypothetical protein A2U01_0091273, partial [Trifolium medium]|nr:hypothetical protein [Trifolium medium]